MAITYLGNHRRRNPGMDPSAICCASCLESLSKIGNRLKLPPKRLPFSFTLMHCNPSTLYCLNLGS